MQNPINKLGPAAGQKTGVEPYKEEKKLQENLNEPVTLTRGQLQGILAELDMLKRGQRMERPKRVTEHVANLRFHEGKPVTWYGNVREIKDKLTGKLVAFMNIRLLGSDEPITVEYLEFLNAPNAVQVQIKEQTAERVMENYGRMQAVNPNPHFDKKWQEFETDMEVMGYKYTATVEVLEGEHKGESFTLPSEALNR